MARVYRMENRQHLGPFAAPEDETQAMAMWQHVPWIDASHDGYLAERDDDLGQHPHHLKDVLHVDPANTYFMDLLGITPIAGQWYVGCKDLDQFYHWFPVPSLPDFAQFGMHLHVYECPEDAIKFGQWQVMFDPTRATLVKSEPLTEPLAA